MSEGAPRPPRSRSGRRPLSGQPRLMPESMANQSKPEKPKVETGSFLRQLTVLDEKNLPQIVNIHRPPEIRDEKGQLVEDGRLYMVTNEDNTAEIIWDLDQKERYEPDALADLHYRGEHTFETLEALEQRAHFKAVLGKLPSRRK